MVTHTHIELIKPFYCTFGHGFRQKRNHDELLDAMDIAFPCHPYKQYKITAEHINFYNRNHLLKNFDQQIERAFSSKYDTTACAAAVTFGDMDEKLAADMGLKLKQYLPVGISLILMHNKPGVFNKLIEEVEYCKEIPNLQNESIVKIHQLRSKSSYYL